MIFRSNLHLRSPRERKRDFLDLRSFYSSIKMKPMLMSIFHVWLSHQKMSEGDFFDQKRRNTSFPKEQFFFFLTPCSCFTMKQLSIKSPSPSGVPAQILLKPCSRLNHLSCRLVKLKKQNGRKKLIKKFDWS